MVISFSYINSVRCLNEQEKYVSELLQQSHVVITISLFKYHEIITEGVVFIQHLLLLLSLKQPLKPPSNVLTSNKHDAILVICPLRAAF